MEQSKRIQTSVLNAAEHRLLVWLAARQPKWVTSDVLSCVGTIGAAIIAVGYILTGYNMAFLWLASFGFLVNWYGDSLDGNLARYRNAQRPIYGYYLDHTLDCVNELMMFVGIGLSPLIDLKLALFVYIIYLLLTINVSMNAHLRKEFKLTYAGMGPTELRILVVIANTVLFFVKPLRNWSYELCISGQSWTLKALDVFGLVILVALAVIYICTIIGDIKYYAKIDPRKQ